MFDVQASDTPEGLLDADAYRELVGE
jgi:hypothetical protein